MKIKAASRNICYHVTGRDSNNIEGTIGDVPPNKMGNEHNAICLVRDEICKFKSYQWSLEKKKKRHEPARCKRGHRRQPAFLTTKSDWETTPLPVSSVRGFFFPFHYYCDKNEVNFCITFL